jgi:transcriptional regulator with XRE-family HTH domain
MATSSCGSVPFDSEYAIILRVSSQSILRGARRARGISQRELARRTGIAQPTIARIEAGSADPRLATLERLLEACGYVIEAAPRPGEGVDRSQMRELLRLSPRRRLELLRDDVEGLDRLERAVRR